LIALRTRARANADAAASLAGVPAGARTLLLSRTGWLVAGICVAAVLLRLSVMAYIAHDERKFFTYDSGGYERRAVNLLEHGVFAGQAQPPFTPDLERTPVYPALIAGVYGVFGDRPIAVIALHALLGAATAGLVFLLARELGLSDRVALIGALLAAVDPVSVMTANRLLTETLFTTLLVAGVWLFVMGWRREQLHWVALASLAFGAAALTRPIAQFLPLALVPLLVFALRPRWRQATIAAIVLVGISGALMASWALRNERVAGVFTLSTIGDTNLIYYRARAVMAAAEGISQEDAWEQLEARVAAEAGSGASQSEIIAVQRRQALEIFREHPGLTASMLVKGAARIVADPGYTITCTLLDRQNTSFDCFPGKATMNDPGVVDKALGKVSDMSVVQQFVLFAAILMLGVLYGGALLGSVRLVRERRWLVLALLLLVIVYFVGLSAGAEANSRFRVPIVPFLAILAAVGIDWAMTLVSGWFRTRQIAREGMPA
jgi:4-amino-4-deoxy-L-arabinose transferase-like glycosyltransferase